MKKRFLCAALVLSMTISLVGCGSSDDGASVNGGTESTETAGSTDGAPANYDETSSEIYEDVLGEFYDVYMTAKESNEVSERYGLMAIAEAKLLESGVMLPTVTANGTYVLNRQAPYTVDKVLWGTDYERYHQAIITTDLLKASDVTAMKQKWSELKGTGTYQDWAKEYLTGQGYTIKDELDMSYTSDPTTWDIFNSYLASDSSAIVNTYDGLYEYDCEGELQPALAESYEVSDDGLTYTFYLRKGVQWVDSQERELGELTADDFVAGMQHLLDAQGGMEYLAGASGCNVLNADAYISGEIVDFDEVGVKAVDDYTVEYTLEEPCSYFMTMLGYSVFAPLCRSYYESLGGKFGSEYDGSASDYTYGTSANTIAYCGPYIVSSHVEKNAITFEANSHYWNADGINIKTIKWKYDDGSDASTSYNNCIDGTTDGIKLTSATLEMAKNDGLFDEYAYISDTDATTYVAFFNVDRTAFANFNDETTVVSPQSDEDKERTSTAMKNVHFRRALCFGVDRASYNAQYAGEELKCNALRNTYIPGNFVTLEKDITIDINGTQTSFAAGTYYGEIVQAQLDADGVPIVAWNPDANDGIGSSDGYDGWYNVENAVAELDTAIEELAEEGVEISEENPIYIDLPYNSNDEKYTNRANAFKQSLENSLGGKVIVNTVSCSNSDEWYYAGYYTSYGYETNGDVYDLTGWIPDFGDPCSYLDTMLPDYAGYQTKLLGIF